MASPASNSGEMIFLVLEVQHVHHGENSTKHGLCCLPGSCKLKEEQLILP